MKLKRANEAGRARSLARVRKTTGEGARSVPLDHKPRFGERVRCLERYKVGPEHYMVIVDGPVFSGLLDEADERVGINISLGVYGTYTVSDGSNTIQLWNRLCETSGEDLWWWMQVRGPAFSDTDLFPAASYRMTTHWFREALNRLEL